MERASPNVISRQAAKFRSRPLRCAVLFLCLGVFCVQDLAPATGRTLRGTVTNDGEPMRGAVVQLENIATMEIRSYITQQDGQYHFSGLWSNVDYQVWARRANLHSVKKTLSQFNEKSSVRIDLILK